MSQITAEIKDEIFRHPKSGTIHFGRHQSVVCADGVPWSCVQMGERRSTRVLLVAKRPGEEYRLIEGPQGHVHQPSLAVSSDGQLAVVWNEATDDGWEVRLSVVDPESPSLESYETVHTSEQVCLPPSAAFEGDTLHVTWSERVGERIRVRIRSGQNNHWSPLTTLSDPAVDAFRPHVSADAGRVVLAWDEYREGRYQIVVAQRAQDAWTQTATLGQVDERWLHARTMVTPKGEAFAVWVVLKPVIDKLGIIDHWPLAMVARIDADDVTPLLDEAHPTDQRIAGDLRDGLLASNIYKGYVGLRRNPFLTTNENGDVWCVWESRGETEGSTVAGPLLARQWEAGEGWQSTARICESGYGYAVAPRFRGNKFVVGSMQFDQRRTDVIALEHVDPQSASPVSFDEKRWQRWQVRAIHPEPKSTRSIQVNGKACRCFWADTHVHSVFSPDAEGELDELVHFARDTAGLDILTIIDNDYYPHKALTEPEWRIHQALAGHFSEEGRFLWMPGYEFTYHRGDLNPDFNHRCISYPSGHGPLHRRIDPDTNTDDKMIPTLKAAGAMVYPHHCTYELIDNDAEWNIEVTSSWRVCIEETAFTIQQLKAGRRLGFIGSSDTHRSIPGLGGARTAVLAPSLTRESVAQAYRDRRLFATQGHNIVVDFSVNGVGVGGIAEVGRVAAVRAHVQAPKPIDYIDVVRDGEVIHTAMPDALNAEIAFDDADLEPGEHFYFLRIKLVGDPSHNRDGYNPATNDPRPFSQDSRYPHNLARARGPFAWASPVWVKVVGANDSNATSSNGATA